MQPEGCIKMNDRIEKRIELAAPVIGHAVTLSAAGGLHYSTLDQWDANLLVSRYRSNDSYRIAGGVANDAAQGLIQVREGADGILGRLANLPGLGPVNLTARASGDNQANILSLTLSAGPLKANGRGSLRLAAREADLDFALSAPAMKPRPDIAWQTLSGTAHFHGRFDTPALEAHLQLGGAAFGESLDLGMVGLGGGGRFHADDGAGARPVLDHDALAEPARHLLGDQPAEGVRRRARAERRDDADEP